MDPFVKKYTQGILLNRRLLKYQKFGNEEISKESLPALILVRTTLYLRHFKFFHKLSFEGTEASTSKTRTHYLLLKMRYVTLEQPQELQQLKYLKELYQWIIAIYMKSE